MSPLTRFRGTTRCRVSREGIAAMVGTTNGEGSAPNVFLWEMTRRQAREGIDSGRIRAAVVPLGSTEQHNEHLHMIHDTASALLVAERAARALYPAVIVATPLAIGVSEHWMDHKGTLTTRPEIFAELLFDVCDSLRRAGITRLLALNGHRQPLDHRRLGQRRPDVPLLPELKVRTSPTARLRSGSRQDPPSGCGKAASLTRRPTSPLHCRPTRSNTRRPALPHRGR